MKAAGPRVVVWPTLGQTSDCSLAYKRALVVANLQLQLATQRYPNLVLADYPPLINTHPEYSEHRCPHLLPAGYHARAVWLADAVRQLIDAHAAAG